jgi:GNAT superfamily N-acetyltransferase
MSTNGAVRIRPIEPADLDAWLPLWRGYQAFYRVDIAPETSRVTWARFLDPHEPMSAALAFAGDEAVGLVHWIMHRSCWTVGDYCYLQDLFVDESMRGKGVGHRLIDYVYDAATAAKCSRVYWLTHESNAEARLLYDRVADRSGFIQYRKILT